VIYPFKAYWLRDAPTSLIFNNCTLCPHCIYVFCIYLRTNSDLCHLQHKLLGFYNRDEKCLQRGTNWVFKYISVRFVCKWINTSLDFKWVTYWGHRDPNKQKSCSHVAMNDCHMSVQYRLVLTAWFKAVPLTPHHSPLFSTPGAAASRYVTRHIVALPTSLPLHCCQQLSGTWSSIVESPSTRFQLVPVTKNVT
jgi:hypothetical protein